VRIILFTGKGGVGKTSAAAATALRAAEGGLRTLVMSTDPAHSLSDSFDLPITGEPTEIGRGLWGQQIDAQERLEENWREIREYAVEVLSWAGMSGMQAEELSVIPGLDELFGLSDIREHHRSGAYDLLIVDCAPTAETLRLLSLPEVMSWYIERIFPVERKIVKAVRPVWQRVRSLPPLATDSVFQAVERFYRRLEGIRDILVDPENTSVRLVMNAEKMVVAEAQRTFTYLSLFGYPVDAVIVNRLIPDEVTDPYFDTWKESQQQHLTTIEDSFAPIPILKARLFDREMVGSAALGALAGEVYGDRDPAGVLFSDEAMKVERRDGGHTLSIRLPFAATEEVDLSRYGDELFVKVGAIKRNVVLPMSLRTEKVVSAEIREDWLEISFDRPAVAEDARR
jgi:arsenite-transporting ATPase